MLAIRVIEVDYLPVPNKKINKVIVSCFSYSSYHYYYGSFKTKYKSAHPRWNKVFNIDLFRIVELNFSIYGKNFLSKNFLIGNVHIDFNQFISKHPGDQIMINPGSSIRCEFPIASANGNNSYLSLSFTYTPKVYRPIQYKSATYFKQIIHLWATFSPSVLNENTKFPVDIEFLQASPIYDDNRRCMHYGVFYNLNKDTPWECTGKSSSPRYFEGPTGHTQIHSICLTKIEGCVTFFILNVSDFSGTVTLHFLLEKKGKFRHFSERSFMKPKISHQKLGTIQTVDMEVRPNTKKLVPVFHRLSAHPYLSNSFEFGHCTKTVEKQKSDTPDYTSQVSSDIEFHNEIMENAQSIQQISKVNFLRVNVLPTIQKVSIQRTLENYGLKFEPNLRFYVGGSTTYATGSSVVVDCWKQGFIVYNKENGQRCSEISDDGKVKHRSHLLTKYKFNSILGLNLSSISTDKVFVYFVHCDSCLESANTTGFFMISHISEQSETLLFRNQMYPEVCQEHFATCFRIEFVDGDWQIFPMRHYFKEKKDMDFVIDSIHSNNWVVPEILTHTKHEIHDVEFSDDEYLINNE